MEDPATPVADADSRRKSGRQVKQPVLYGEDPNVQPAGVTTSGKRKRGSNGDAADANGAGDDDDDDDDREEDDAEDSDEDSDEGEPDPEEEKEKRRRAKAKRSKSKPAAKKPKVAKDGTVELAMRPAVNGVKKASKSRKPRAKPARKIPAGGDEGSGLYKEVFAQGKGSDDAATEWLQKYGTNAVDAMRDFVNFAFKCSGFDGEIDDADIEDVDNVAKRLTELQDEYIQMEVTEYPLIVKAKGSVFSRAVMVDFVETLLEAAHQTEVLYNDVALIENMQAWIATMSASSSRPFRHTATVIGLAMGSAMCSLHRQLTETIAATGRQKNAEAKKKSANKERVKAIQSKIKETEERKKQTTGWIKEIFDGIFVHRYRDVDPRIRVDCAQVLGSWIEICPDIFFVGEYMRYLGWVLSDAQATTRIEVLKQLSRLYRDSANAGRLNAFTERFKGRMVEMACQDADPAVRAASVELLDMIRELGMLEPEDVDSVGKLIFDAEPRVRKSVKEFFAASIQDAVDAAVEELGGEETLSEALGEEDDEDYSQPKRSWLKFNSIAAVLEAYDADDADVAEAVALGADNLIDTGGGTRFSLAAEIVCVGIPEVKEWESLAGYLLYDFSVPRGPAAKEPINVFKESTQPDEKQESILLEILQVAVRIQIEEAVSASTDRRGKARVKTDESRTIQESTAQSLGQLLPKLLNKFGSNPQTVIAVLRLEQLLNLDIFQDLRQDSNEFAALLDDISKHFMTHADSKVLEAARDSLLHAKAALEFAEVTESKVEEVWEDALKPLQRAAVSKRADTGELVNALQRVSNLASITDCVDLFERPIPGNKRSSSSVKNVEEYLRVLLDIYGNNTEEIDAQLLVCTMQALLLYTLWKVKRTRIALERDEELEWDLSPFATALTSLIEARSKLDEVRLSAIGVLLDAYTAQLSLRQIETEDEGVASTITSLITSVPTSAKKAITASFIAAERDFAKKSNRNLSTTANEEADASAMDINGEPEAPESESEESSDDDDDAADEQQKKHEVLRSERRLCELTGKIVLSIVARVIDAEAPGKGKLKRRIAKNKTKLGAHFKEVLSYLEEPKVKVKGVRVVSGASARAKTPAQTNGKAKSQQAKSKETIDESDEEEDEEDPIEDGVEGDENDLRRKGVAMDKDDIEDPEGGDEDEDDEMGD